MSFKDMNVAPSGQTRLTSLHKILDIAYIFSQFFHYLSVIAQRPAFPSKLKLVDEWSFDVKFCDSDWLYCSAREVTDIDQ